MTAQKPEEHPKSVRPAALITGAGRGIGRGIALALAGEGFDIAANDIVFEPDNPAKGLFEVKQAVERSGVSFLPVPGDVADLGQHDCILAAVLERFGRLDLLVNNAGVAPLKRLDILETTPESYDRVMAVNARGAFFLSQKAARQMIRALEADPALRPAIVFITSISAEVSSTSRPEYCLSKAALSMAARIFADALAGRGIGVYEVRPGIIRTEMTEPVKEKYDFLIGGGLVPQGRWGFPEDVGRVVAALARGDFGYATGAVIEVSGGMNIRRL
ncbi:MAG: 3-ketoacyl-ACP reductase [Candidatus Aminicenantes bacterium]|nr:3-ketoacyl-ACP reductase [Candidatus Aminicenantes bacterium]